MKPVDWRPFTSLNKTSTDVTFDYSKLFDFGFKQNHKQPVYTLFGVRYKEIVRVVYTFDEKNNWMEQNVTTKAIENFNSAANATFLRVAVTEEFFIVSNSNGIPSGISFFDHDLNLV